MATRFFGEKWDAPMADPPAEQVPTPVGQKCLWCDEPIVEGDRGILTGVVQMRNGVTVGNTEPVHMECQLRQVVGGLAHLQQRCLCCSGDGGDPEEGMTRRDGARASLAYVEEVWRHGVSL